MSPFSCVGVIGKRRDPQIGAGLVRVCSILRGLGCTVLVERHEALPAGLGVEIVDRGGLAARAGLAVILGGDGTLLDAGRSLAAAGIPLLGINLGRLGFMADVPPDRLDEALGAVVAGHYEAEPRLILEARLVRAGQPPRLLTAVNDVVLRNQASIRMLEFETWMNEQFISSHRADGMIVASPTGSTAYALSGGGPLLHPSLAAIVLVPICPHTLSDRPIVVPADAQLRLVARGVERTQASVTLDGQIAEVLEPGDSVEIRRAAYPLTLIHPPGYDYFGILRDKLRWGRGPHAPAERV